MFIDWGGGWLSELGYIDFAGSGIVHMLGGMAGGTGAYFVGPRLNRYNNEMKHNFPHNVPFVVLGTFLLWFGWYGFNCGSTLSIVGENNMTVSKIGMTTTISATSSGLTSFILDTIYSSKNGKKGFILFLH